MSIYIVIAIVAYLSIGFGFALAAWLEKAESEVNKTGKYELELDTFFWFVVAWPVLAVYCYRTEVSKTVKPIDMNKL